ncbi:MAG: hypothetical protein O7E52_24410 [Candidatus Poribacteria bacterium]|nr:hypothetical protein [Candidatus Poribacteria bacterium]
MKTENNHTAENPTSEEESLDEASASPKARLAASRRDFLKKGLVAAAFVPPTIQVFVPTNLEASSSHPPTGCKHINPMPHKGKGPFCRPKIMKHKMM